MRQRYFPLCILSQCPNKALSMPWPPEPVGPNALMVLDVREAVSGELFDGGVERVNHVEDVKRGCSPKRAFQSIVT